MRVLGRQQLSQISSRIGYQGDLRTLASHLDDDDDLVLESYIYRLYMFSGNRRYDQQDGCVRSALHNQAAAVSGIRT